MKRPVGLKVRIERFESTFPKNSPTKAEDAEEE